MVRSTAGFTSVQAHSDSQPFGRMYIGTNGPDVIDYALSLDFILSALLDACRETGDDIAVWIVEDGESPRLIACVRALAHSAAVVQML